MYTILLKNYINANKDYIGFFTCEEIDNVLNVKIIDFNNVEYLYHLFINDIYYFLRTYNVLNMLNVDAHDVIIVKESLSIVHSETNKILLKVNVVIF